MSEQIREQVSAFLDGELPGSETELLLKRLTRDAELRESFGRYALIGEACRGAKSTYLTRGLTARINSAIDGEAAVAAAPVPAMHASQWWRPAAGATLAAGVAVAAVLSFQHRVDVPAVAELAPIAARGCPAPSANGPAVGRSGEPVCYTTPPKSASEGPLALPRARLANYVLAHGEYSSLLSQRDWYTDVIVDNEAQAEAPLRTGTDRPQ